MSEDIEEAQRREEAARERLRETEAEAGDTLEQAEELEDGSVAEPALDTSPRER